MFCVCGCVASNRQKGGAVPICGGDLCASRPPTHTQKDPPKPSPPGPAGRKGNPNELYDREVRKNRYCGKNSLHPRLPRPPAPIFLSKIRFHYSSPVGVHVAVVEVTEDSSNKRNFTRPQLTFFCVPQPLHKFFVVPSTLEVDYRRNTSVVSASLCCIGVGCQFCEAVVSKVAIASPQRDLSRSVVGRQ